MRQIFLLANKGVRCINTANELAHYEFGAALASDCILKAMDHLDIGVKETELGADLQALGQKNSVVTIAAAGKRFEKANLYPMDKEVKTGDPISLTVGYRGGLSSRCGYAVRSAQELPGRVEGLSGTGSKAILSCDGSLVEGNTLRNERRGTV